MHIVTGGAGFIGSAMIWKLNQVGVDDILVVDNLGESDKWKNLAGLRFEDYLHRDQFHRYLTETDDPFGTEAVFHMGACSATTERNADFLMENNYRYSQLVARFCLRAGARLVNASSAATYGDGSLGFSDDHQATGALKPLNMYGYSKQLFDLWALRAGIMDRIASLKFFNVYGPNEYHKGDMMSVVCKAHAQILESGRLRLFKSHREDFEHGGQLRDFVYVRDCVDIMWWLFEHPEASGIFNVGTGEARSFRDLGLAVFRAMGREPAIDYIDMPEAIRDRYQYFTRADMGKLRAAGYEAPMTPLEDGVADYVQNHLATDEPHLVSVR